MGWNPNPNPNLNQLILSSSSLEHNWCFQNSINWVSKLCISPACGSPVGPKLRWPSLDHWLPKERWVRDQNNKKKRWQTGTSPTESKSSTVVDFPWPCPLWPLILKQAISISYLRRWRTTSVLNFFFYSHENTILPKKRPIAYIRSGGALQSRGFEISFLPN